MKRQLCAKEGRGTVLIVSLVFMVVIASFVTLFLAMTAAQAKTNSRQFERLQALYEAYGELEIARVLISDSDYNQAGENMVVVKALSSGVVPGTQVKLAPMSDQGDGSWYMLTAECDYNDGQDQRVVSRIFRDRDYYSSYNMFVSADPVGIAGAPVGPIHTNKQLQFYFPNGLYKYALTSVEGAIFRAGASEENTNVVGLLNTEADRIDLDLEGGRFGIETLKQKVKPDYNFPADRDVKIALERVGKEQYLSFDIMTQPRIDYEPRQVLTGYKKVNPREEEYEVEEQVLAGHEIKTRDKTVYKKVTENVVVQKPVYRNETISVDKAVWVKEQRTRQVPVYVDQVKTKMVEKKVWVEDELDLSGGTAIGGDGGSVGHWEKQWVEKTYTESVFSHYRDETYDKWIISHYEKKPKTIQVVDHYVSVEKLQTRKVKEIVTEEYEAPIYKTVTKAKTRTIYDKEPVYKTVQDPVYVKRQLVEKKRLPVPENGVVYAAGNIISLKGDVVGNLSIATEGKIDITGDIRYRDAEGDTAYLNGKEVDLPYEPNPDYENNAVLGLIARDDIIYTNEVPNKFEINASLLSITGRVGIDGVELNNDGEIKRSNRIRDEFGRRTKEVFRKKSIRRLGGITSNRRPVDTVVAKGRVKSGFRSGKSAFDTVILACPPPFYMAMPVPRFFDTQIIK